MKILSKNKKGFTLIEIMIAGGLVGGIALLAGIFFKMSNQTSNTNILTTEVSFLKNLVISNFSIPDVCAANLVGQPANRTGIPQLVDKIPQPFLVSGNSYGQGNIIRITNIATTSSTDKMLALVVTYDIKAAAEKVGSKKTGLIFSVEINVVKDAGGTVTSCFVDGAGSIRRAIQYSCSGNGATYAAGAGTYGTCSHNVETKNASASVIATPCPAGQYLAASTATGGLVTLQCQTFSTPPCPTWSYVNGIDSNGAPVCVALSTLYTNGMVMSATSGGYQSLDLNCPTDQVLARLNPKLCIPKVITKVCPANEYISAVDNSGNVTCSPFTRKTAGACPSSPDVEYLSAINADGSIPAGGCKPLTINADCSGYGPDYVLTAIDSNGNAASCVNNL